jgi:NitT/TauT family transport system substrate-binding protein
MLARCFPGRSMGLLAVLALLACTAAPAAGPAPARSGAGSTTGGASAPSGAAPPATPAAPSAGAPAAPSTTASPRVPLSPPVRVHAAYPTNSSYLPFYLAVDKGYFQEEGLDLELTPINVTPDLFAALASGQIDVGGSGADPALFNAVARGVDTKIVGQFGAATPISRGLCVLVRKDLVDSGRYREPRDLKGMNVAVPTVTSSGAFYLERALARAGLKLDDVTMTSLPYPDANVALANKAIDAAVQVQPFVMQAENEGTAQVAYTAGEIAAGYPSIVLLMAGNFTRSQPEAARRFLVAFLRAQREVYTTFDRGTGNKNDIYDSLARYTPIKDPGLNDALARAGIFNGMMVNGDISVNQLDEFQDFFVRVGAQQEKLDLGKVIDRTYVDYAIQQLGRVPTD